MQFALVLSSVKDPSIYVSHGKWHYRRNFLDLSLRLDAVATHRFTPEEGDWGFTRFYDLRNLFSEPWGNKGVPLVQDDEANITAYVRVVKDPTGVLWHSFQKYSTFAPSPFFCSCIELSDVVEQLRLQERDRHGWPSKPGCHLLLELPPSIALLYQRFSEGMKSGSSGS